MLHRPGIRIDLSGIPTFDEELEADALALQSVEWLTKCPHKARCPCARLFKIIVTLKAKNDRLEHEINRIEQWPDEK